MNIVRLGDVCKIISGSTPKREIPEYWDGTIPWVTPKEISRLASPFLWESAEKITEAGFRSCSTAMLPVDSLLLSSRAPIGLLAINKIPVCTNQGFKSLIPSKEVSVEYLYYVLKANVSRLQARGNGATFKELAKPAVENFEIPLPSLDDQIRIAHLLSKVEGLIVQRKQHLQQLDDLLKSVFLEMFGFRNGTFTQWPIERLALHTEVVSGVAKGKKYATDELVEVPYMRVANVQDGHFVLSEVKTIAVTQKEIVQYQLRRGDLLLTEGGDPDKLGRGSVWEEQVPNCIHQNHIFRVRINEQAAINPHYLSALVGSRYGKTYFLKSAKQTTGIASINSTQLKSFPTLIPPLDLQNRFSTIVEKVQGIKSRYQQSLTDLESLYGTLSQQAFKGELDLSRVSLPADIAQPMPAEGALPNAEVITPTELVRHLVQSAEPQGRHQLLARWFQQYLVNTPTATGLRSAQILEGAWQALQTAQLEVEVSGEEEEEEESPDLADYDVLKALIFKALDAGELLQTFDGDRNRVALAKQSADRALRSP